MKYKVLTLILLAGIIGGCAPKKITKQPETETKLQEPKIYEDTTGLVKPKETEELEIISPEEFKIETEPKQQKEEINLPKVQTEITTEFSYTTQGTIPGYRVQVGAFILEENAQKLANEIRQKTGYKVYIEKIDQYYKVRVGDCLTREEAEQIKSHLKSLGYDAFIVETLINTR